MSNNLKDIRRKFDAFMKQAKSDPTSGADILTDAYNQVEDVLKGVKLRLSWCISLTTYTGIWANSDWRNAYLYTEDTWRVTPDNTERFWSHWHLVDSLAILQRNRETVEEQIRLYRWTCEHLSDGYVIEALFDTTQAKCWKAECRIDEWFQLYDETSERLGNPEVSRYTRCLFLQAGAEVSFFNDRLDEALLEVEKLERLNSIQGLEQYFQFWLTAITTRLLV